MTSVTERIAAVRGRSERRLTLMQRKGERYTGGGADADKNFATAAKLYRVSTPTVVLILLEKHLSALREIAAGSACEPAADLEERIMDCQNYLDILYDLLAARSSPA